jgi:hypothetical protein
MRSSTIKFERLHGWFSKSRSEDVPYFQSPDPMPSCGGRLGKPAGFVLSALSKTLKGKT